MNFLIYTRAPMESETFSLREEPLVLASTSPRRAEILSSLRIPFEIFSPPEDELPLPAFLKNASLEERLIGVAVAKGKSASLAFPRRLVVSADTIVHLGGKVLGKPKSPDDARRMLEALSGRKHRVATAVAVHGAGRCLARVESTVVRFRSLSAPDVDSYLASGEPFDKAGAYGIQGLGGFLVSDIQGRHDNVVGLPMLTLYTLLLEFGVNLLRESHA